MITIAMYRNLMSAELAKTRLESRNIKAAIADACFYTLGFGAIMDGVRLQVADADAERAKDILTTVDLAEQPDDCGITAGSPEAGVVNAGTVKASTARTASSRSAGWAGLALFLFGIFCLILGRPANDWRLAHPFSGQFILAGAISIVTGLWIAYGRLSTAEEDKASQE